MYPKVHCSTVYNRAWKQPRCPSTNEWIQKLWYIYTKEYPSAIKRNIFASVLINLGSSKSVRLSPFESVSLSLKQMNLEPIIQSAESQKEKYKYCVLMHIYGIFKAGTDEPVCRAAVETQTQRTDLRTQWGKERAGQTESSMETYTLPHVKQRARGQFLYDSGNSTPVSVTMQRGGRES